MRMLATGAVLCTDFLPRLHQATRTRREASAARKSKPAGQPFGRENGQTHNPPGQLGGRGPRRTRRPWGMLSWSPPCRRLVLLLPELLQQALASAGAWVARCERSPEKFKSENHRRDVTVHIGKSPARHHNAHFVAIADNAVCAATRTPLLRSRARSGC